MCYVGLAEIQLVASNYFNFFFNRELHRDRWRRRRAKIYHKMVHDAVAFPRFSFVSSGELRFFLQYYRIFFLLFSYAQRTRLRRCCWAASCGFSQLQEENAASFPFAFLLIRFLLIAERTNTTEREGGERGKVITLLSSLVSKALTGLTMTVVGNWSQKPTWIWSSKREVKSPSTLTEMSGPRNAWWLRLAS